MNLGKSITPKQSQRVFSEFAGGLHRTLKRTRTDAAAPRTANAADNDNQKPAKRSARLNKSKRQMNPARKGQKS